MEMGCMPKRQQPEVLKKQLIALPRARASTGEQNPHSEKTEVDPQNNYIIKVLKNAYILDFEKEIIK